MSAKKSDKIVLETTADIADVFGIDKNMPDFSDIPRYLATFVFKTLGELIAADIASRHLLGFAKSLLLRKDVRLHFISLNLYKQKISRRTWFKKLLDLLEKDTKLCFDTLMADMTLEKAKEASRKDRDNLDGLHIKEAEKNLGSSLTYGEIDYVSFFRILYRFGNHFKYKKFYDLGSGSGRALVAARMLTDCSEIVGIELLESLHDMAEKVKERLELPLFNRHLTHMAGVSDTIEVVKGSITEVDWSDGDFVFANSTCFNTALMQEVSKKAELLKEGSVVVTFTKGLTDEKDLFMLIDKQRMTMSWGPATVYVYLKKGPNIGQALPVQSDEKEPQTDSQVAKQYKDKMMDLWKELPNDAPNAEFPNFNVFELDPNTLPTETKIDPATGLEVKYIKNSELKYEDALQQYNSGPKYASSGPPTRGGPGAQYKARTAKQIERKKKKMDGLDDIGEERDTAESIEEQQEKVYKDMYASGVPLCIPVGQWKSKEEESDNESDFSFAEEEWNEEMSDLSPPGGTAHVNADGTPYHLSTRADEPVTVDMSPCSNGCVGDVYYGIYRVYGKHGTNGSGIIPHMKYMLRAFTREGRPFYPLSDSNRNNISYRNGSLMVWLHGASARNGTYADHIHGGIMHREHMNTISTHVLNATADHTKVKQAASGNIYNADVFWVLYPICPAKMEWKDAQICDTLMELINNTIVRYCVNEKRIYLGGASMGGLGTWMLAARNPHKFAAIAPMCGGGNKVYARLLRSVPTWFWHACNDNVIGVEETDKIHAALLKESEAALKQAAKDKEKATTVGEEKDKERDVIVEGDTLKYTRIASSEEASSQEWMVGHNVWEAAWGSFNFWMWMMAQQLDVVRDPAPTAEAEEQK
jgi:poly(3-hydroxybutyrate) depolymerase